MLDGQKIMLRYMREEDIERLYNWENDQDNWRYSDEQAPYTYGQIQSFVTESNNNLFADNQLRFMICDLEGNAFGTLDLFNFDAINLRCGVGILIADKTKRGKGYAREALLLLKQYVFEKLQLNQLYCEVTEDNSASCQLFESVGFECTGIKKNWRNHEGQWLNEHFYQLLND